MAEIKKVPAIRFKGFNKDWEHKTLGDLGYVSMNKRIFKYQTSATGDVPFYKIGTFGAVPDAFISRGLFEEYRKKYSYPSKGDLLISASGSIGRIVEYSGKDEYFQDSNIVWLEHDARLVNSFLKQFYSFVKWGGLEGSTIKRLYNKDILDTKISIPAPSEQTQIGSYFQHLDKLISLHQTKINKLTNLKKAMLEKMLPKQGADVPEIRFKGFAGGWVEKTVGDIFDDLKGTGLSKEKIGNHGKYKCILYGHLFTKFSEVIDEIDSRTDFSEGVLSKENDILMPSSTTTTGIDLAKASSLKESGVLLGGDIIILRMKEQGSSDFYAYYLTHGVNKKIAEVTQGTTIIHLYFSGLKDVILKIPSPAEQTKIGAYFQNLDKSITLHQTELEKLNNLKKACLEKMFV